MKSKPSFYYFSKSKRAALAKEYAEEYNCSEEEALREVLGQLEEYPEKYSYNEENAWSYALPYSEILN